jgi:hypothetical protein
VLKREAPQPFQKNTPIGPDGRPLPPVRITVVDSRPSLETLLGPYLDRPVPIPDDMRERWRRCGFRIVAIPVADLEPLQDRMRITSQVQRQWLGEVPAWTDVVRGPDLEDPRPVALDSGDVVLEPGRTSLRVRCWSTPIATESGELAPALRLQLAPEHAPRVDQVSRWRAAAGLEESPGAVRFARLAMDLLLTTPGEAYVITADAPDADWAHPAAAAEEPGTTGPVAPRAPTLGELMLSAPEARGRPRARAVVVLVPRIPSRFDLLP